MMCKRIEPIEAIIVLCTTAALAACALIQGVPNPDEGEEGASSATPKVHYSSNRQYEANRTEEVPEVRTEPVYSVTEQMSAPEYMDKFTTAICGLQYSKIKKWSKKQYAACDAKFRTTFSAKLVQTYPMADWQTVNIWCEANPIECQSDMKKIEAQVKASNEAAIERQNQYRQIADENRRSQYESQQALIQEQNDLARKRALGQMLQNWGAQMQQINQQQSRPRNCTTSPNGFGGYYTNCY